MKFLKWIYQLWIKLGLILSWITTRLILIILFYLTITPTRFIARLFGKHFLDLEINKSQKSYWNYRVQKKLAIKDYENQF